MESTLTLQDFVDQVGSQEKAASILGAGTQMAISKALKRNVYVVLSEAGQVLDSYEVSKFPNPNRAKAKTSAIASS